MEQERLALLRTKDKAEFTQICRSSDHWHIDATGTHAVYCKSNTVPYQLVRHHYGDDGQWTQTTGTPGTTHDQHAALERATKARSGNTFMKFVIVAVVLGVLSLVLAVAFGAIAIGGTLLVKAPWLFLYIVICFFFPPALLAIPFVIWWAFKEAEIEVAATQVELQQQQLEEERERHQELLDRLDRLEDDRD